MAIHMTLNKGRVPVKIWTRELEYKALQQLINLSQLPIIPHPIAAMPDVHAGKGATSAMPHHDRRRLPPCAELRLRPCCKSRRLKQRSPDAAIKCGASFLTPKLLTCRPRNIMR